MPRLFTGLEVPPDVARDLDLMRGGIEGARWIERESYHITLRFIGDIEDGLANDFAQELARLAAEPFALQLAGIGLFGGAKPHALFAGVAESPELRRLQATQERLCQVLGMAPEPRKFTPHVTLARLRNPDTEALHRFVASHNLYRSRVFDVGHFVLYSSRPSRGGGPYAVEESYQLQVGL